MHYNCTIIDLFDRSVIATISDNKLTTYLAIRTLKAGLKRQTGKISGLILHSDQGSQFTSREFKSFCQSVGVIQSMSRAGCPTDNAPTERFSTLLNLNSFILTIFILRTTCIKLSRILLTFSTITFVLTPSMISIHLFINVFFRLFRYNFA